MNKKCFYVLVFGLLLSFSGYAQSDSNAQQESKSKGSFFFSGGVYNGFFPNGPIVPIPNFEIKKLFAAIASGNYEFPMGPGNTALGLEIGYSSGSRFGGKGAVDFIPFGINAAYVFPITNFFYAGPRVRIGGLGLLGSNWNKMVFTTGARLEAELRSINFPFGLFVAGGIDIVPFAPELAILPVIEAGIRFPRGKLKKSNSPAPAKDKEPPVTNTGGSKDDLADENITASTAAIVPPPAAPEVAVVPTEPTVIVPPPVAVAPVEPTLVEPNLQEPAAIVTPPVEIAPVVPTSVEPDLPEPALPEIAAIVPQPEEPPAIVIPPVEIAPVVPAFVEPTLPEPALPEIAVIVPTPEEPAAIIIPPVEIAPVVPAFVEPTLPEPALPEIAVIVPPPEEPVTIVIPPVEPAAIIPSPVTPPSVVLPPVVPPEPTAVPAVTQAQRPPIQGITGASQAQNISVILEDGRPGILNSIYFKPDTAILIELYRSVLNGVGRRLAADPSLELIIRAYAAYFGTADGRHTVSSDRAVFSRDYLASEYGIAVNRFSTEVYGADRSPKYATEDWQTHRCVELILVRK